MPVRSFWDSDSLSLPMECYTARRAVGSVLQYGTLPRRRAVCKSPTSDDSPKRGTEGHERDEAVGISFGMCRLSAFPRHSPPRRTARRPERQNPSTFRSALPNHHCNNSPDAEHHLTWTDLAAGMSSGMRGPCTSWWRRGIAAGSRSTRRCPMADLSDTGHEPVWEGHCRRHLIRHGQHTRSCSMLAPLRAVNTCKYDPARELLWLWLLASFRRISPYGNHAALTGHARCSLRSSLRLDKDLLSQSGNCVQRRRCRRRPILARHSAPGHWVRCRRRRVRTGANGVLVWLCNSERLMAMAYRKLS